MLQPCSAGDHSVKPSSVPLRPEAWSWHLLGLVNPLIVIAGNLVGGPWTAAGLIYMLGLGPLLDPLLGTADRPRPPRRSGRPFESLLYAHAILQLVAVGTLLALASRQPAGWIVLLAAISTGINSGASGLIVAHELGHRRRNSFPWWIGRLNLLSVVYLHFTTEHNRTHHKHVATIADPASARLGESVWWFIIRTVPGQFLDALRLQAMRGHTLLTNPIARGMAIQILLVGGIAFLLGPIVCGAFLIQAAFAVFLLEYINYIRHYGLHREVGERQTAAHSWQSEHRWSRWTLLELTRHPAHHLEASKPFWQLQPYDHAPQLPSGYYGCFWVALVPPLWRQMVHPRLPPKTHSFS
jgi:alkane 1-monooxygenase